MSNYVFVIDQDKQPLNPVPPGLGRKMQTDQKAATFKKYPYTLILNHSVVAPRLKGLTLKLDPGSKFLGLSILDGNKVIWAAELEHRGWGIHEGLEKRSGYRRNRRSRKTGYRKNRGQFEFKPDGWLPPSLLHRVQTTMTWVNRLRKLAPIEFVKMELVKFDTQLMDNADIEGTQYQQGTLAGYTAREYLLEKWGRQCAYCSKSGVPLQVEHVHPKSKGGSNSIRNLCLACEKCNTRKGSKSVEEFLKNKPEALKRIQATLKPPLKDAAAVNATRWALYHALQDTGLPVSTATGARTKMNRAKQGLPKEHWIDAACVGDGGENLDIKTAQPLRIQAKGHGSRQMCKVYGTKKNGEPIRGLPYPTAPGMPKRRKDGTREAPKFRLHGSVESGDIIDVQIPNGKYKGIYKGVRVAVRGDGRIAIRPKGFSSKFDLTTASIYKVVQRKDGYAYSVQ
ncbi:HNH endonuclease [Leptolyngbyaceae cyanobacterium CCMR0082]|uniref:HNH endonuclease n=1 Tax=Adonisia turfae CCMR0082 TaxID=2304604 RepID=A0A6M0SCE5_9CYAN|nr:RNA-guided endonuclease IscB [Adonisia turfae]NEZ65661.1 HNH endonuclease [Adonisia turfae CCMR0082]